MLHVYNGSGKQLYISSKADIVQRDSLLLRDVEYVIDAHFEMTAEAGPSDNSGKFKDIMIKKAEKRRMLSYTIFWVSGISGKIL